MSRFSMPAWVEQLLKLDSDYKKLSPEVLERIKKGLSRFSHVENPVASIVIPAWNEEENIVRTLASLSANEIPYEVELIVVNNNSTDSTQEILDALGVQSFFQPTQGISVTRKMGLEKARGKILLSADADSLYPPLWGKDYIEALLDPANACVYGRYSFIPSEGNSRVIMGFYEILAESVFRFRKRRKDYLNVMGFNSAFRIKDAHEVGGYSATRMKWEDGMMAMKLMAIGNIKLCSGINSRPWTSDRRLMADGSLWKAFKRRIKKEVKHSVGYI